ncbi:H-NS histone family protein [uncultured Roseovarius sp.]|uniref:H-NS histone family protein n=1 Tax=uncultured Roseovarius sp. TaxID=293344 RepID=UPI0026389018|nr:H-NS histone family protein [uncultured Roseovarius sp.]
MKIDLKSMTRKQLERLRVDVDIALAKLIERERKAALIAAEKAANAHGFTLAEIAASAKLKKNAPKATSKTKAVAKYANPENKSQKWSGKGRQPEWFKKALASGKKEDQLLI